MGEWSTLKDLHPHQHFWRLRSCLILIFGVIKKQIIFFHANSLQISELVDEWCILHILCHSSEISTLSSSSHFSSAFSAHCLNLWSYLSKATHFNIFALFWILYIFSILNHKSNVCTVSGSILILCIYPFCSKYHTIPLLSLGSWRVLYLTFSSPTQTNLEIILSQPMNCPQGTSIGRDWNTYKNLGSIISLTMSILELKSSGKVDHLVISFWILCFKFLEFALYSSDFSEHNTQLFNCF